MGKNILSILYSNHRLLSHNNNNNNRTHNLFVVLMDFLGGVADRHCGINFDLIRGEGESEGKGMENNI